MYVLMSGVLVKVSSLVRLVLSQLCRLRVLKIAGIVYIYVTQLRSGDDPRLRNTLENASY